jgi:hypothetical protein
VTIGEWLLIGNIPTGFSFPFAEECAHISTMLVSVWLNISKI